MQRCLEKDPDDRWQSARDLAAELQWIHQSLRQPDSGGAPGAVLGPASRRWMFTAAGLALAAAVFLTLFLVDRFARREAPATAAPPIHSRVRLPEGVLPRGMGIPVIALSPDGRLLAFVGMKNGVPKLFVHRLDRDQTIEVPDSTEAEGPFFSPDAQWIAFAVGVSSRSGMKGELKKYSLATGLTQSITETADFFGCTWRADGTILFMGRNGEHLRKVRAEGGRHEPALAAVRPTGRKVGNYGTGRTLLPGGRIPVNVEADDGEPRPAIVNLDNGDISVLEIVSPYHLHRKRTSSLHADGRNDDGGPVDVKSGTVAGAEVAVISGTSVVGNWEPAVAVSDSGVLAYSTGPVTGSAAVDQFPPRAHCQRPRHQPAAVRRRIHP